MSTRTLLLFGLVIGIVVAVIPASIAYHDLSTRYDNIVKEKEALEERCQALIGEKTSLEKALNECSSEKNELLKKLSSLEEIKETLEIKINDLINDKKALQATINTLQERIDELVHENEYLKNMLIANSTELANIVAKIYFMNLWYGVYMNLTDLYNFYDKIMLSESINAVKDVVNLDEFRDETDYRYIHVFERTLFWFSYYSDNFVRYIDPESMSINVTREVYMLSNETWVNQGGDCDDLALFVYSVLKATQLDNEHVYLISWYTTEGIGHRAVLVVREEPNSKFIYIVDPAGNYINDLRMFLKLHILDSSDREWVVYLDPLRMYSQIKFFLYNRSLAEIIYYDHMLGKYVDKPVLHEYTSAIDALYRWIRIYWGVTNLAGIDIDDVGVHESFTSIEEAGRWIQNQ